MNQSYLPKQFCWNRKSIQVATRLLEPVIVPFLRSAPCLGVLAFSGWRRTDTVSNSDHLCGFALDLVPKAGGTTLGYAQLRVAQVYANAKRFPYVEFVWGPTNKHLHVSFARCPRSAT